MKVLKEVLFGQQKQSNDLNETVTRMIYNDLMQKGYNVKGVSDEDHQGVFKSIEQYINGVIQGKHQPDDIFELIAGRKSVQVIKEGGPCILSMSSVSDESTKIKFRVLSLTDHIESEHELEERAKLVATPTETVKQPLDDSRYYASMAEKLKNKILPTVPEIAKKELAGNDYAIALSCVVHYFDIKEEI